MVRLQLSIKADLENITDLTPSSDFEYFFRVKCNHCHTEHPKTVSMNPLEEHEMNSSRSTAHFVWRCSECSRDSSAKFEPVIKSYSAESNGQLAPLLVMDCRGLEFIGFEPRGSWTCKGLESGTVFSEVDLSEDWTEYDEKTATPVSIMDFESEWNRAPQVK